MTKNKVHHYLRALIQRTSKGQLTDVMFHHRTFFFNPLLVRSFNPLLCDSVFRFVTCMLLESNDIWLYDDYLYFAYNQPTQYFRKCQTFFMRHIIYIWEGGQLQPHVHFHNTTDVKRFLQRAKIRSSHLAEDSYTYVQWGCVEVG